MIPGPQKFDRDHQVGKFGPKFDRLATVLERDGVPLTLISDPLALAPERLLVFEVSGQISNLSQAIKRVPGLELIDEEEIEDSEGKATFAYLLMPDIRALNKILSLWKKWKAGKEFDTGYTPWRDVFSCLVDLRVWGPEDRIDFEDLSFLEEEIAGLSDQDLVKLEIELVHRKKLTVAAHHPSVLADHRGGRGKMARMRRAMYRNPLVKNDVFDRASFFG